MRPKMNNTPKNAIEPTIVANLRILEIGPHAEITSAFPDQTQLFWTYYKSLAPGPSFEAFSLRFAGKPGAR